MSTDAGFPSGAAAPATRDGEAPDSDRAPDSRSSEDDIAPQAPRWLSASVFKGALLGTTALVLALSAGLVLAANLAIAAPCPDFVSTMAIAFCFAGFPAFLISGDLARSSQRWRRQYGLQSAQSRTLAAMAIAGAGLIILVAVPAGAGRAQLWPWLALMFLGAVTSTPVGWVIFRATKPPTDPS